MTYPAIAPEDLKRIDIFHDLTPDELSLIAPLSSIVHVPQGTVFGRAEEVGPTVFCICEGRAELHATAPHIGDVTMRIAGPGQSFPLAALVSSGKLITTARAMTEMEVVTFKVQQLRALCETHSEIGRKIYANVAGILAERYRASLSRLTHAMGSALKGVDYWANV